jgi:hypothetical protein
MQIQREPPPYEFIPIIIKIETLEKLNALRFALSLVKYSEERTSSIHILLKQLETCLRNV